MSTKLILNAAEIRVPDVDLLLYTHDYKDENHLREIRAEFGSDYHFKRRRDRIEAVAITETPKALDWDSQKVRARAEPSLVTALTLKAFLSFASSKGSPSRSYDPVAIPGGKNLLSEVAGSVPVPDWLQVRTRFHVSTRVLQARDRSAAPFIILDADSSREILAPISELMKLGFDPVGKYVRRLLSVSDPLLAAKYELIGAVEAIQGSDLKLIDAKDDFSTISADDAFVEPREEIFAEVSKLVLPSGGTAILRKLEIELAARRQADSKLDMLNKVLARLSPTDKPFRIAPGLEVTFGSFITNTSHFFPAYDQAPATKFVFDVGKSKVSTNNRGGLHDNGPYNWANFTPTSPRIAVVCASNLKGTVETFLGKFKNGVKLNLKSGSGPFNGGFQNLFRLTDVSFQIFESADLSPTNVAKACQSIVDRCQAGTAFDLVIMQNSEQQKWLKGSNNPYLVAKSILLKAGIPSQAFLIEKAKNSDYDLAYILADMALGVYAKLGGTPWLIAADHAIEHEIILGVGSASVGTGRFGALERVVGITSVFKGDGDYILSNLTKAVPFKEYADALKETLDITIGQVRKDMNWRPGDGIRIIVHAFKPMKNSEVDAIEQVIQSLGEFQVQFAFVHVKEGHPYSIFDPNEPGVFDNATKSSKGKNCPKRGTYLLLTRYQSLVCPWGSREVRYAEHGYPKPLMLELHDRSSFTDLTYLSRQLLNFASHSWRSFSPAKLPVTILYSDLVADLLSKLAHIDGWSASVIPHTLGKRRWFL